MRCHFVAAVGIQIVVESRIEHEPAWTPVFLGFGFEHFVPQGDTFAHQMAMQMVLKRIRTVCVIFTLVTSVVVPLFNPTNRILQHLK